jgi:hypothetical protein
MVSWLPWGQIQYYQGQSVLLQEPRWCI